MAMEEERLTNNDIHPNQHCSLKIVGLAVRNEIIGDKDCKEEDHCFEYLKLQTHRLAHDPSQDYQEGGDQKSNLHAASNRDPNGKIHLVL